MIRTETTYVSTMADLESSKTRSTEQLKFVATLDSRTSMECQKHDGMIVDIDKAIPGKTIPPLHCFCRSVMIDVIEGLEHGTRIARDQDGNNFTVPANMTYDE